MKTPRFLSMTLFIFIALIFGGTSYSQARTFGLGAIIGDPTGVSVKMWLDQRRAVDGAFAWSMSGPNAIHIHSTYLIHNHSLLRVDRVPLSLYYGAGGRISSYSGNHKTGLGLGARAPLGIAYQFRDPAVELFGEIAGTLELIPSTHVFLNLAIGGRFYF